MYVYVYISVCVCPTCLCWRWFCEPAGPTVWCCGLQTPRPRAGSGGRSDSVWWWSGDDLTEETDPLSLCYHTCKLRRAEKGELNLFCNSKTVGLNGNNIIITWKINVWRTHWCGFYVCGVKYMWHRAGNQQGTICVLQIFLFVVSVSSWYEQRQKFRSGGFHSYMSATGTTCPTFWPTMMYEEWKL